MTFSLDAVQAAHARLHGHVLDSPFLHSRTLSAICGAEIFLKFENLQFTASFKERGALNKLAQLSPAERARGVLAVSAGNHAQGVAFHAQRLGIAATIVMPRFAPAVKVENTRRFGANVVLEGETFDDARSRGLALAAQQGFVLVHPYDDADVIAGQGTIALEMLAAEPSLDTLCISVGGGGLIGGIATAAKALKPGIEVIGVQTERFPAMVAQYRGVALESAASSIAEGIAVKHPGELTKPLVRQHVNDMLLVTEEAIEEAILMLLEIEKTVVEGAGAAGLAAVLKHAARFAGRRVGLVLCGGNIDPLLLAEIIQRGLARSQRLSRISVATRDVPGALSRVATIISTQGANIEEVSHQRTFSALAAGHVSIDFVLATRDAAHVQLVLAALRAAGLEAALH